MVLLLALYILLKPAVPVIDFLVNYGYIITELCVNRDRPELECNGKCYLKKELAEASKMEQPISKERKIPLPGHEIFFQKFRETGIEMPLSDSKRELPVFRESLNPFLCIQSFFHPPTANS